ncbi:MAG TPA: hypothetical protein VHH88_04875 [Verrucomicrobiae bacterium]|nr:hypothetical protein [Verrucomicrobiae bacterium]
MAQFFKIAGLEARKRALAEESEVYRQMLELQWRNARAYQMELRQKFRFVRSSNKMLLIGLPVLARLAARAFVRRKRQRSSLKRAGLALVAAELLKRAAPLALRILWRNFGRRGFGPRAREMALGHR